MSKLCTCRTMFCHCPPRPDQTAPGRVEADFPRGSSAGLLAGLAREKQGNPAMTWTCGCPRCQETSIGAGSAFREMIPDLLLLLRKPITDADIELIRQKWPQNFRKSSADHILPISALTPTEPPDVKPPACATCGLADSMPDQARPGTLCAYCAELIRLRERAPRKPARKLPDYTAPSFWQWLCAWTGLLVLVLILTGAI